MNEATFQTSDGLAVLVTWYVDGSSVVVHDIDATNPEGEAVELSAERADLMAADYAARIGRVLFSHPFGGISSLPDLLT
jgi:hypothetical protein